MTGKLKWKGSRGKMIEVKMCGNHINTEKKRFKVFSQSDHNTSTHSSTSNKNKTIHPAMWNNFALYIVVLLRTFQHCSACWVTVILPCNGIDACAFVFACATALFTDSGGHVRKSATLSLTLTPMKRIQSSPNLYTLTGIRKQITLP